ncbi:MAG: hypothetical protein KH354_07250 [Clostridiales bacterium]|nr:hypothetical protein [Clostridiales bacterium]
MLEFLCELFFEGVAEAAETSKLPVWLRLTLFSTLCLVPISISVLGCFSSYQATGIAGAIVCGGIAVFLIVLWILGCRKIIKRKR